MNNKESYLGEITKLPGNRVFALNTLGQERRNLQRLPRFQLHAQVAVAIYDPPPTKFVSNWNLVKYRPLTTYFAIVPLFWNFPAVLLPCFYVNLQNAQIADINVMDKEYL